MSQTIDLNTVTATVDDVELLTILGLSSLPSSPICKDELAVLDWDDMPELSEEEEDDDDSVLTNKRKQTDDDDVFADVDFVEAPLLISKENMPEQPVKEPEQKKRKVLQQPSFVDGTMNEEETLLNLNMNLPLDDGIQLALDLISS